jgi:hypothetical protein
VVVGTKGLMVEMMGELLPHRNSLKTAMMVMMVAKAAKASS